MRNRGMKILALAMLLPALFASCTKSGALTGGSSGSSGSFSGGISGSVSGGLSSVVGATVNLFIPGNATPLATAITASDGSYTLTFSNPGGTSLLYLSVTGGNAGGGINTKNQFLAIAGTTAAVLSNQKVNEMTTAAVEFDAFNLGILQDTNGTVTLSAPKNGAGATNAVTQYNNLIATGNLNTANANLVTATQNGLKVMADMFASCIEAPAQCSTLFNTAVSTGGSSAVTLLESGVNALNNSANVASSLYTIAFPLNANTGFTLSSASMPGGFSFNNAFPASTNIFNVGGGPQCIAFDASGNAWISSAGNGVVELSATGTLLNNFSVGSSPFGIVIDAANNIWLANIGNSSVTEINSSGTLLNSISMNSQTVGLGIDPTGNIWVAAGNGAASNHVTEISASGTVLNSFATPSSTGQGMTIDASGNIWLISGGITVINSAGSLINKFSATTSFGLAIDSAGNAWSTAGNKYSLNGTLLTSGSGTAGQSTSIDSAGNIWTGNQGATQIGEMNPNGLRIATYTMNAGSRGVQIDINGNVWVAQNSGTTVTEIVGAALGPQFFPYSGPMWAKSP